VEQWVRAEYRARHCNQSGRLVGKINLDGLREVLRKLRPNDAQAITKCLKQLSVEICEDICRDLDLNQQGRFRDLSAVNNRILATRPDLKEHAVRKKVIEHYKQAARTAQNAPPPTSSANAITEPKPNEAPSQTQKLAANDFLRLWISSKYLDEGFQAQGFIGWKRFETALVKAKPGLEQEIKIMLNE
ncbi:hypothetical protein GQ44DRAFT_603455, partial [Phaeosphaeriaceae sp. PMI808]